MRASQLCRHQQSAERKPIDWDTGPMCEDFIMFFVHYEYIDVFTLVTNCILAHSSVIMVFIW